MFKLLVLCFSLSFAVPAFAEKKGRNPASSKYDNCEATRSCPNPCPRPPAPKCPKGQKSILDPKTDRPNVCPKVICVDEAETSQTGAYEEHAAEHDEEDDHD
jgi:hypothetical protein